jgi:putative transcriptional regulator
MTEFRPVIKELREARNLTQKELADLVGIDVSTLRNWESGRSGIELIVKIAKLCNVLDCSPEELVITDP